MPRDKHKLKILFLCTGNACRSQIAHGWAEYLKSDIVEVYSAGIRPIGVNPWAIKIMAEAGVDISDYKSECVDEFANVAFDYVITLCDDAAGNCPIFPAKVAVIHKPFKDPYYAEGSEEEIMAVFRKVRDQIREFVETIPESLD